jgi:ABC-type transport system involved in multi-copper enzyme maturation permease subunit
VSEPRGTIHDLGYKRYVGSRRDSSTRWRVIARHQIAHGWKTWWRFKAALALSVIVTCIAGGFMLFASESKSRLGGAQAFVMRIIDTALPESIAWFCRAGFVVSLTIGATVVASDMQSGAFTFYFARSVKPRHYVIGKLVGQCVLLSCVVLAGPLVLAGLRLGVSDNLDQLVELLPVLPKALAIGVLAVLVYAAVPMGFSALLPNKRQVLALWAAYYMVFGSMAYIIGRVSHSGAMAALDLPRALQAIAYELFDIKFRLQDAHASLQAAIVSVGAHVGLAIAVVVYQVRRAHLAGIGGGS